MNRMQRTALAGAAALVVALTGCAQNADPSGEGTEESLLPPAEGTTQYPLTLESAHGESVLEERPERIAIVGWHNELETVAVLGGQPVLSPEIVPPTPALDPHLDESQRAEIEQVDVWAEGGLPLESIAASDPDLILAISTSTIADDYDRLAEIAPVLGPPEASGDEAGGNQVVKADWRESTRAIARALDLRAAGEEAISDTEQVVADAAAEHPEWQGTTISMLINRGEEYGVEFSNYAGSNSEAFLSGLGFAPHPEAGQLSGTDGDGVVSPENFDLFDADVLIVAQHGGTDAPEVAQEWLESQALYQGLPVVRDGRVASFSIMESPLAAYLNWPDVLSERWLAENLAERLDGVA